MSYHLESLLDPVRRAEAAEADRLYRAVQAMPIERGEPLQALLSAADAAVSAMEMARNLMPSLPHVANLLDQRRLVLLSASNAVRATEDR